MILRYNLMLQLLNIIFLKRLNHSARVLFAQRLVNALPKMGPAFVKFGQLLSTRPDLVSDEIAGYMCKLQDEVPQEQFSSISKVIKAELGITSLNVAFSNFEPKAAAAASIAQVHKAVTIDNVVVAVKVLRSNIRRNFESNIAGFKLVAEFIDNHFTSAKRLKLPEVIRVLSDLARVELDLRLEAAAADKISKSSSNIAKIPKILWQYTTKNVLVMEWIDGYKINKLPSIIDSNARLHIVRQLLFVFFNQTFVDGFFHADLHHGNIVVIQNLYPNIQNDAYKYIIGLLDFGITGGLSLKNKRLMLEILQGFLDRDYDRVAKAHFDAGYVPSSESLELFSLACRSIGEPIIGKDVSEISISSLLTQLFEISKSFNMNTQLDLLLLQKNMVMVEGIARTTFPDVNMWLILEEWITININIINKLCLKNQELFQKFTYVFSSHLALIENINNASKLFLQDHSNSKRIRKKSNILLIILMALSLFAVAIFTST